MTKGNSGDKKGELGMTDLGKRWTMTGAGRPDRAKTQKLPVCRKVVKPPKPAIFSQTADSDGNINLKIWRVYPL
jgi:hypothetical protein